MALRKNKPTQPRPARTESITAAAKRIPLGVETGAGAGGRAVRLREPQQWQNDVWDAYDQIGQVKAPYNFVANSLARLKLYPAVRDGDDRIVHVEMASGRDPEANDDMRAEPLISTDLADAIADELDRITNPMGGVSEILRLFGLCLGLPGECYLVGRTVANTPATAVGLANPGARIAPVEDTPPEGEGEIEVWEVYAPNELRKDPEDEQRVIIVESESPAPGSGIKLTENDVVVRVWRRHPRWKQQPDSHMRAALTDCDELLAMSRAFQATMMSRNNAGVLTFPAELNATATDEHGDQVDGESGDTDRPSDKLMDSMIAPVADPTNAASVVPHMIVGPGKYLSDQYIRHISLARDWPQIAAEERRETIERLAMALPLPPEVVTGKADVNHWTAWQIKDETYQAHIEPEAQLIVDALVEGVIRPGLRARGFDEDAVRAAAIGIDPTELVVNPDRLDDAKALHKENALSDAALRREAGFGDEDAPDEEELMRRVALGRGIFTADLTATMLRAFFEAMRGVHVEPIDADSTDTTPGDENAGDGDTGTSEGPPANDGPVTDGAPPALAASGARGDLGVRLAGIDRTLRDRLNVAVDDAMRRALDRAGARLRTRGRRDETISRAAADHPNGQLASILGPSLVAALNETPETLIPDDAFDGLRERWDAWVGRAQEQALAAIGGAGELTAAEVEQFEREQQEDSDAGWLLLVAALLAVARARLYSPHPEDVEGAEVDLTLTVAPGVVREALARAGGETHVGAVSGSPGVQAGSGAGVARRLLDASGRPAGGVTTGQLARRAIAAAGLQVSGFRWHYGDPSTRQRNFEPHRALDGLVLSSWDETVLRVGSEAGWLRTGYYYPGDHPHCQCDFEPVVTTVAPPEA